MIAVALEAKLSSHRSAALQQDWRQCLIWRKPAAHSAAQNFCTTYLEVP
jgi:hypothetical protein